MKTSFLNVLLISLCFNLLQAQNFNEGISEDSAKNKEALVNELFAPWDRKDSPGVAVAIVKEGELLFANGYGMANLEYDIPITTSTIFDIASVSKQFTVFSILLLEKEGMVNLEDDVRKYLPELPDFGKTITLRHLASHTSGLRDQWVLLEMAGWKISDVITQEDVLGLVKNQKELNFLPGEEFLYSNTGFMLLAEVVEKVSGKSFAEFAEEKIFKPLEMYDTLVYDDFRKLVKNRAYSYYDGKNGIKKGVMNVEAVGQGNVYSSVGDLALWVKNLQAPRVGDTAMINKMNKLQLLNNGETFGGALGQFVKDYRGMREIFHPGRTAGFNAYISRFPAQDFAVVILSNAAEIKEDEIAHKITDIYLQGQFKEKEEPPVVVENQLIDPSLSLDPELIASYMGEYELQPGVTVSITEENGQLLGKPTGGSILKFSPISKNEFIAIGDGVKIVFPSTVANKAEFVDLYSGQKHYHMPRVVPFDKAAVELEDYTGEYRNDEISVTYDLKVDGEGLLGQPQNIRLNNLKLGLVKEDTFVSNSPFYREVNFVRDHQNIITGFKVSSERVKNLFFLKINH